MMMMHRSAADIVVEFLTPVKATRNDFYITENSKATK
jgi:hypothetical protein